VEFGEASDLRTCELVVDEFGVGVATPQTQRRLDILKS
jgi:hypothetical protein